MFIIPSAIATGLRYPLGLKIGPVGPRPEKRLALYEFEACPYCRRVREALSMLDLDADIRPCPRNGTRFRPEAIQRGGKSQFPLLEDPNVEPSLVYETDAIIAHLYARYGAGSPPWRLGSIGMPTSTMASAVRAGSGRAARPSKAPGKPLELWSFESSPYCRWVREALCELELPYVLHNLAKGSAGRDEFRAKHGKIQVPFLADPNTGTEMFESREIVKYLVAQYSA